MVLPMKKVYSTLITMFAFIAGASAVVAQSHLKGSIESARNLNIRIGCFRFIRSNRLLPNGQIEPFSIPEGKTLVVTDVEWVWNDPNNVFLNQNQVFRMFLGSGANDVVRSVAMYWSDEWFYG
jgi:hypothetical protein